MTVQHFVGDLFTTPDRCIAHGCNGLGVMGAGVALLIRKKWPRAYQVYRQQTLSGTVGLGDCVTVDCDDRVICNMITQASVGSGVQVDYQAIAKSYSQAIADCQRRGHHSMSMPRVGAGLGGGDWTRILDMICDGTPDNFTTTIWCLD